VNAKLGGINAVLDNSPLNDPNQPTIVLGMTKNGNFWLEIDCWVHLQVQMSSIRLLVLKDDRPLLVWCQALIATQPNMLQSAKYRQADKKLLATLKKW
jgi:hypothetical protein